MSDRRADDDARLLGLTQRLLWVVTLLFAAFVLGVAFTLRPAPEQPDAFTTPAMEYRDAEPDSSAMTMDRHQGGTDR